MGETAVGGAGRYWRSIVTVDGYALLGLPCILSHPSLSLDGRAGTISQRSLDHFSASLIS